MRRIFLFVLCSLFVAPLSIVSAHGDEEEGYSWDDDPKNSKVFENCSDIFPNGVSSYMYDFRLPVEISAIASRIEVVSADAVVSQFSIAATNWGFHREQPDAIAHAERRTPGYPSRGLLLRLGFERWDALTGPAVSFQVKVFATGSDVPEIFEFSVPMFVLPSGDALDYMVNFICREESDATSEPVSTDTAVEAPLITLQESTPVSSVSEGFSSGFVVKVLLVVVFVISGASALLLLVRRRRF